MIIECFGTPGSGKTRLLRELTAALPQSHAVQIVSRKEIVQGATRFALRHPVGFLVWMTEFLLHANGLYRYKLGLLLRAMAARSRAEALPKKTVAFIDEGMVQRILSLFDKPLSKKHIRFLLRVTPAPDLAIIMKGGDFGRFMTAEDRLGSVRALAGRVPLEQWIKIVTQNAEAVAEVLPLYTQTLSRMRGMSEEDIQKLRVEIERVHTHVV